MKGIVTLTLNPAIDGAAEAEQIRPIHKIRTWAERYDPGGGGINVARSFRSSADRPWRSISREVRRAPSSMRWCRRPASKAGPFPSPATPA